MLMQPSLKADRRAPGAFGKPMDIESGVRVDEKFEALDLGDPRRDRRASELLKRLAAKPTVSIPAACDGWAETMAAYRFLGSLRLSQTEQVEPALVLYIIVAWRIARLMRLGRTCPDLEASLFFHADEIKGAYLLAKKARHGSTRTLNQMIRLIPSLGGFLGRKGDGEPGAKTLWIGLERTMNATSTIQALRMEDA